MTIALPGIKPSTQGVNTDLLDSSTFFILDFEPSAANPTSPQYNSPTQTKTYYLEKPLPQQQLNSPQSSDQLRYNPLPPTPNNPDYLQQRESLNYQDGTYYFEGSIFTENTAIKNLKDSQFPSSIKQNLDMLRSYAKQSNDPKISLDLVKFLLSAADQLSIDEDDTMKAKKAHDAMIAEAQKISKKLANHLGMGKQGYPEAQYFLANCYGTGAMGLQMDPEKAFALYLQGSKQNHPGCTFRAAVCYEVGAGTKRDKNHAMQFYKKAANLGEQTAMYKLGVILLKGFLGQPKNSREGISWLKRAAQLANEEYPHALHELGLCFEKEDTTAVIPDLDYARELFTKAAQYGYAPSQYKLGLAYENGFLNCPVDPRRSIVWYSKAAEQGDVEAEFALSGWYLTGAEGILPQNDKEAYLWARKAAEHGSAKAEYAVGYYTEMGMGVEQDLEEAKRWYTRAAAQDYNKAIDRLYSIDMNQKKKSFK